MKSASDNDNTSDDQDIVRCLCEKNEEMGLMLQVEILFVTKFPIV